MSKSLRTKIVLTDCNASLACFAALLSSSFVSVVGPCGVCPVGAGPGWRTAPRSPRHYIKTALTLCSALKINIYDSPSTCFFVVHFIRARAGRPCSPPLALLCQYSGPAPAAFPPPVPLTLFFCPFSVLFRSNATPSPNNYNTGSMTDRRG